MPRRLTKYEEEKLDKRGSSDPDYVPPDPYDGFDFTKPGQWQGNGDIVRNKKDGIWKPPMYLAPGVYPNRKVLRFPKRPQIAKNVRWGEYQGKPPLVEKWIDPLESVVDAREFTVQRPLHTVVPQLVDKPGPPVHWRLHRAVASGDKKVSSLLQDLHGRVFLVSSPPLCVCLADCLREQLTWLGYKLSLRKINFHANERREIM